MHHDSALSLSCYDLRAILVHFYPPHNATAVFFRCIAANRVVTLRYLCRHLCAERLYRLQAHWAVVLGDSSEAFGHNRALADVPTTLGSAAALRAVAYMTLRKGKTLSCRI